MRFGDQSPILRVGLISGVAVAALVILLASTHPRPADEYAGVVRRLGGPCLELERWDLFGWNVIGQTYSVDDTRTGTWHDAVPDPPSRPFDDDVQILVRLPLDAPEDIYRMCGLADERACIEFEKVPFRGTPGP